jgi:hypothetical protein
VNSSWNRRLKFLGLIDAWRESTVTLWSAAGSALMRATLSRMAGTVLTGRLFGTENWDWPPGRCMNTTSSRATDRARSGPVVVLDECQRQVDARRDARSGERAPAPDEDRVGADVDEGVRGTEPVGVAPVRGSPLPVQVAARGQEERPRAH